jgi:hypothetical protein
LVQAVKRNVGRFPGDFMFQLTADEFGGLKSQFVISNGRGGARRALPYAFTEQGVAMLSAVLNSPRAIHVSIEIMRAFVRLRRMLLTVDHLARKLEELERKALAHDEDLRQVFAALRQLMAPPQAPRREIGFHVRDEARTQPASSARPRKAGE